MARMKYEGNTGGLALTRRLGEVIVIVAEGKVIEITFVQRRANEIRLHVKAPKDVLISRKETIRNGALASPEPITE